MGLLTIYSCMGCGLWISDKKTKEEQDNTSPYKEHVSYALLLFTQMDELMHVSE